ncbi:MAG: hypothetical protein ACOY46_03815 [Bacillota bacterium]
MAKRIISLLGVFVLIAALLIGCGQKSNNTGGENTKQDNSSIEQKLEDVKGNESGEKGSLKGSGTYTGQIDGNSVEIKFDGKDTAFRLSDDVKSGIESKKLNKGDTVTFNYYKDQYDRLVITDISKSN